MTTTTLNEALWNRTDIATLRAQFNNLGGPTLILAKKDDESIETFFPWLVDVLCWIHSNNLDKSDVFYRICSHGRFLGENSACLVDFFLRYCAPVDQNTLDSCLGYNILFGYTHVAQRLLDAGAHLTLDFRPLTCYDRWLMIQDHRLDTRAIARAVLHVASRPETRRWVARDVWRIVAKMVWSKRF